MWRQICFSGLITGGMNKLEYIWLACISDLRLLQIKSLPLVAMKGKAQQVKRQTLHNIR